MCNKKELIDMELVLKEIDYFVLGIDKLSDLVQKEINERPFKWQETFAAQATISLYLYVPMSTVVGLIKKTKYQSVKEDKELFKRIQIIRNHFVVHREKKDFYQRRQENISISNNSNSVHFYLRYVDGKGSEQKMQFEPRKDLEKLKSIYRNILD